MMTAYVTASLFGRTAFIVRGGERKTKASKHKPMLHINRLDGVRRLG